MVVSSRELDLALEIEEALSPPVLDEKPESLVHEFALGLDSREPARFRHA